MLALSWSVYFGFGLVSTSLAALITPIRRDLGLSYSEVGVILGAWQLVYIVVAYPAGLFVDTLGTRRAVALGVALVALSALGRSVATSFVTLFLAVAIFGVGGPIVSIGLPKVIASWFTGRPRALASGIYTTGSTSGNIASLALTNSLVLPLAGSWQMTCGLYGLFAGGIGASWWLLARDPLPLARHGSAPTLSFGAACRRVLTTRMVWLVVAVGFTGFMLGHGFRSWLPQILEFKGFTPAEAGFFAALPGVGSVIGSIVVTRVATRTGRKPAVMGCLAADATALLAIDRLTGPTLVGVLVLEGFCAGALLPLLLSILMDLREVGAEAMGAAAGIYFSVGEVGGFTGPSVMGLLKDLTGSFSAGMMVLAGVALVMLIPTSLLQVPRRR
ncbi:MAG: MFS transporter [Chloroflexi bacterium]|nr:MFS transporter [Chloroflexota bacterium]